MVSQIQKNAQDNSEASNAQYNAEQGCQQVAQRSEDRLVVVGNGDKDYCDDVLGSCTNYVIADGVGVGGWPNDYSITKGCLHCATNLGVLQQEYHFHRLDKKSDFFFS